MKPAKALTRSALRAFPLPRQSDGGKDAHGRLLVVAGSRQVPGSALLCTMAALRSGAGKVRIATVASVAAGIAIEIPEALVVPLPETRAGGVARAGVSEVRGQAAAMDAVVAGPGIREGAVSRAIAKALVAAQRPLAIDAGLLHDLAPLARSCRGAEHPPVLLPHSREMASLLGCDEEEVEADRLAAAHKAAEHYGAFVLAKGSISHVAAPDGRAWTYSGGAPGLGIAGSGDTLAGIVGGLLARGAEPLTALLWAVLLHGEAGEVAVEEGRPGRLPGARDSRRDSGVTGALSPSLAGECRSSSSPTSRTTWMTLVEPAVPNGTPAISTSRSPPLAMRWRSAMRLPLATISSKLDTSREWTGWTPHKQAHPARRRQRRAHRQQRHRGPLAGDPPGGRARAGVADHRGGRDGAGDLPGRAGQRVGGRRLELGHGEVDSPRVDRVTLGAGGDPVHHRHRLARIFAGRAFRRQHDCVGPVIDCGRNVADLGPGRGRRGDHQFQHLRRHHHRLAELPGAGDDLVLQRRHVLGRKLDAEVAARDHHPVGQLDDLRQAVDRGRLFDLGHQRRFVADQLAGLGDVLGPLDERQRDPVGLLLERESQVERGPCRSAPGSERRRRGR